MKNLVLLSSFISLSFFGCASSPDDVLEQGEVLSASDDAEGKADTASSIAFTTFSDDIGSTGTSETRKLFTTQTAYKSYFGHKAPASVDFSKQWVIFYSAGVKNTGGYTAAVETVSKSKTGLTLKVTTSLTSPGAGCFVTEALTKPYVLGTVKKQSSVQYVQFYRDDTAKDCTCVDTKLCVMGKHWDKDACACVDNTTCAATTCPTGSTCVEENGTATCLSQCATVKCAAGYVCKVTGNAVGCVPADGTCAADSDCTLSDNYCGGCACDALGPGQSSTTCSNPVNCFAEPCQTKVAWCNPVSHKCEARPTTGIACGSNHCGTGEYCCNSSCGMCAKMGMLCIQIACTP